MLATVLAAHVIKRITIKHFEKVFSFMLAMRTLNAERRDFIAHFGTGMWLARTVHENATEGVALAVAPKVTDNV